MPRKRKPYKIRYGILEANQLSDSVLVVGNPNYGTPIASYGSRPVKPESTTYWKLEHQNNFYTKLEASLLKEGIKNPIFCQSIKEGTFCRYGSSRLWIAKKNGLKIPCIIADYVNRWDELPELKTEKEILAKYNNAPSTIVITPDDIRIEGCSHHHLSS